MENGIRELEVSEFLRRRWALKEGRRFAGEKDLGLLQIESEQKIY